MPRSASQTTGDLAESRVAERLVEAGWQIIGRNIRVGRAEIDILAVDPGPPPALVVVEVRHRGRRDFGLPEETVDHRKRARLWAAGCTILAAGSGPSGERVPVLPLRLDLVAVEPASDGERLRHHRSLERR